MSKVYIKSVVYINVLFVSLSLFSQNRVTVDPSVQRVVNKESIFNRDKYFHIHQLTKLKDEEFNTFKLTYDLPSDYRGSRLLDSPMKKGEDGFFPEVKRKFKGIRAVENRFVSGSPKSFFYDKEVDYSKEDMTDYIDRLTSYIRDYYAFEEKNVPKYIEPLNEPMVHLTEFYPEGRNKPKKYLNDKIDSLTLRVCELHRELGKKIHASPELANVKVAGYASAFPMFEAKNFKLWRKNYQKFMDEAGDDVDVFSVHLYDGKGINNNGGRRSGSNVEAVLDLIESYSAIKFHKVKPIAITEYGRLVSNQEGWPEEGISNYDPIENSQALRSQMHMSMAFVERGADVEYAIPFTMAKTPPRSKYSKSSLWIKTGNNPATWEYTPRVQFFEIWKGVKGRRVLSNSNNIDVQIQAFVDGKKLYLVLNNLNDETQTVQLDLLSEQDVKKVYVKRLKVFVDDVPELTKKKYKKAPKSIDLVYGESAVLTYVFKESVKFKNKLISKKYYADTYLKEIKSDQKIAFNFNNVNAKKGVATLRLSIGRNKKESRKPIVYVNNQKIDYSGDVIRGYDQDTRKRFFGTLEIPVDVETLKNNAGNNVKVVVQFPDSGGHVSSAVLQVQNYSK